MHNRPLAPITYYTVVEEVEYLDAGDRLLVASALQVKKTQKHRDNAKCIVHEGDEPYFEEGDDPLQKRTSLRMGHVPLPSLTLICSA